VDYGSLKLLDNELKTKSENDLLMMDYCYFWSEKNNYQFVTIQTILRNRTFFVQFRVKEKI
jgi:hypothetical protein